MLPESSSVYTMFGFAVTFDAIGRSVSTVVAAYAGSLSGPNASARAKAPARYLRPMQFALVFIVALPYRQIRSQRIIA